jgi:hypothetical protein
MPSRIQAGRPWEYAAVSPDDGELGCDLCWAFADLLKSPTPVRRRRSASGLRIAPSKTGRPLAGH